MKIAIFIFFLGLIGFKIISENLPSFTGNIEHTQNQEPQEQHEQDENLTPKKSKRILASSSEGWVHIEGEGIQWIKK